MTVREIGTLSPFTVGTGRPARRSPEPRLPLPPPPAPPPHPILAPRQEWPLRSYRELPGIPVSVRSARRHTRKVLYTWCLGAMTDTVELLVSEITTNAVRTSPQVGLWLTSDGRSVLIQVWDGDPGQPCCRDAGPDAEAGRGLLLVETLSAQWGCFAAGPPGAAGLPAAAGRPGAAGRSDGTGRSDGKVVWALCAG